MNWIYIVIICTINFIQSDSGAWIRCNNIRFNNRDSAMIFYNDKKKLILPDSLIYIRAGIYNVKIDSIKK
jgi:hypothetical protein